MSQAVSARPVTIAEFETFARAQPEHMRWELVDGHILAMTNPTAGHGEIVGNIGVALRSSAREHGCRANLGGLRVQAEEAGTGINATIPDILVTCGPWQRERTFVTDPVIVVEVLSPSTMDIDRGLKLDFYKSLQTLKDVVLIYQDQIRVEHYRRDGDGWAMAPLTKPAEALALTGLPASVLVSDVYAQTGLA